VDSQWPTIRKSLNKFYIVAIVTWNFSKKTTIIIKNRGLAKSNNVIFNNVVDLDESNKGDSNNTKHC